MKLFYKILLGSLSCLCLSFGQAEESKKTSTDTVQSEWVNLLADDKLDLWRNGSLRSRDHQPAVGEQWSIKEGVLFLDKSQKGRGGHIITKKDDYFNFELKFEFMISELGNSGVKYRVNPQTVGLEYQVLDDDRKEGTSKNSIASLYNLKAASADKKVNKPGKEWNTGRIIANGNSIQHWLNGEKVMEIEFGSKEWNEAYDKSKYKKTAEFAKHPGPIFLQDHSDTVRYRKVMIREISAEAGQSSSGTRKAKKKGPQVLPEPVAFKTNCAACHLPDSVQVGPHFAHIQDFYPKSKRKQFIEWAHKPGKRNEQMPQMPSMAHVSKEDLAEIHDYILSVIVKNPKGPSKADRFPDTRRPRLVRTFLPNTGPASLYVALPGEQQLNLIWDTEKTRLRYLTVGEPDNYPYLKSNGNSLADAGKTVYTEQGLFTSEKQPEFNGYSIKQGLPTFLYTIGGKKISEAITMKDGALVRTISCKTSLPPYELKQAEGASLTTKLTIKSDQIIILTHTL